MPRSALIPLSGDRRKAEYRAWAPWLEATAALVSRFDRELGDDPLGYNETASVSLLAAGAAQAGHLGIAEFSVVKGHKADRRIPANGRCDFWMRGDRKSWGFEFKQRAPARVTDAFWLKAMDEAKACARCLRPSGADERVAGLIVSLGRHEPHDLEPSRAKLRELAALCDYAWELRTTGGVASDTFFFFEIIGRRWSSPSRDAA